MDDLPKQIGALLDTIAGAEKRLAAARLVPGVPHEHLAHMQRRIDFMHELLSAVTSLRNKVSGRAGIAETPGAPDIPQDSHRTGERDSGAGA
jgi:hypothetical protein